MVPVFVPVGAAVVGRPFSSAVARLNFTNANYWMMAKSMPLTGDVVNRKNHSMCVQARPCQICVIMLVETPICWASHLRPSLDREYITGSIAE